MDSWAADPLDCPVVSIVASPGLPSPFSVRALKPPFGYTWLSLPSSRTNLDRRVSRWGDHNRVFVIRQRGVTPLMHQYGETVSK